jgi:hypothetical protein
MSRLGSGILTLVLLAASPVARAEDGANAPQQQQKAPAAPPTALQVARKYARQLKDGDPVDAVRRYWDLDMTLDSAFGKALTNVTAADRQEMKRLLLEYVERVYTDPDLAARLTQATLEGFRAKEHEGPPRTATVNYYLIFKGDRTLCTVLMRQSADQRWRIMDGGAMGRMLVPGIRKEYNGQADRMTPLEFMQELATRAPRS